MGFFGQRKVKITTNVYIQGSFLFSVIVKLHKWLTRRLIVFVSILGETEEEGRKKPGLPFQAPQGVPKPRARMKQFKLNDVTVPLEPKVANQLVSGALSRIIACESESLQH